MPTTDCQVRLSAIQPVPPRGTHATRGRTSAAFCSLAAHGAPVPQRRPLCAAQTKTETRLSPIKPCRQSIMGRRAGPYLAGLARSRYPIPPRLHHRHSASSTQPAGLPSPRSTGGLCHLADERRTRGAPGSILYAARDALARSGAGRSHQSQTESDCGAGGILTSTLRAP